MFESLNGVVELGGDAEVRNRFPDEEGCWGSCQEFRTESLDGGDEVYAPLSRADKVEGLGR